MMHKTLIYRIIALLPAFIAIEAWAASYVYKSGEGLLFSWQKNETVGVTTGNIEAGMMEQLKFWTSGTEESTSTDRGLFAVGYKLNPYTTYYSYRPYIWSEAFDARNITCSYAGQVQDGNASTAALSNYDYQMAAATTSSDACTFIYKRVGGVVRLSFIAPETMSIRQMTLKADKPAMATSAKMNIMSQQTTLGDYSSSVALTASNISVGKGSEVVLYLMLPAQDLSTTNLSVMVTDGNGAQTILAMVKGPNIKPGFLYEMALGDVPGSNKSKGQYPVTDKATVTTAVGIGTPMARSSNINIDKNYVVQKLPMQKKGDVNGDGTVDVLDVVALTGYYSKGRTSELPVSVCDMNDDGEIDVLDVINIISLYTKAQN